MKSMKIVMVVLQLSFMLLAGCAKMSVDPYDERNWLTKIYSNPPGAEILVNGVSVGTAPLDYSYPLAEMLSRKEVVAKFPAGIEQSLTTGYCIYEIFFDFIHNKATIKDYPEIVSFFTETREVVFEPGPSLPPEIVKNALSDDEIQAMLSTGTATQPKPPDISVGPLLEIFNGDTGSGKLKVIADVDGRSRVILFSKKLQQVLEIVNGPEGVVGRRVIRAGDAPDSIDAAFDAQGRLHVMLDDEHLILEGNEWQTSDQTPWHDSGLKVWGVEFVPGAPDLTWAFQVNGAEFDAPIRMDIYGFGGYGAGIIWPWFTHDSRTVLVSETAGGYGPWFVLDPQRKEGTYATGLASDRDGNVYVVYERSRGGFGAESSYYYVRIDSKTLRDSEVSIPGVVEIQVGTRRIRADGEGTARLVKRGFRKEIGEQVAADPESGTALVGMLFVVHGKTWSSVKGWPLSDSILCIDVVPGGQDSFHVMAIDEPLNSWWGKNFPVQYLLLSAGEWSAPVELGIADLGSFGGNVRDKVGIANVGSDKAFLVWPTEQGIVGRWVQRNK
jgi:hypothetical protein